MKRWISLVLTVTLMLTSFSVCGWTAQAAEATTITLTTSDVLKVMNHMLRDTALDDRVAAFADYDGNADINTSDARRLLQRIINKDNVIELPGDTIRVSTINDSTASDGTRTYYIKAPQSDTYTFSCSTLKSIELSRFGEVIATGTSSLTVKLGKGNVYTLKVKTSYGNRAFSMTATPKNNPVTLPYDLLAPEDLSDTPLTGAGNTAVNSPTISYVPRTGGTYLYCNNPEQIPYSGLGKCFMRDTGLTGEVFMTFEHSNKSGYRFYLGYQVKHEGTSDVFITVTNVGYQTQGSWYGQKAWYDFYNTNFDLSDSYYSVSGASDDYLYENYTPRVYQPTTYRLPAGKYMYVIGGTTSDAYNNINVGNTANLYVPTSSCANGIVKFDVVGGAVTGSMYCYNSTSQVKANPAQTGYWTNDNYYLQYLGKSNNHGVIDNQLKWVFHDNIGSGMLPVTYSNYWDSTVSSKRTPYYTYRQYERKYNRVSTWMTNINPQNEARGVGSDMVTFNCVDINGKNAIIDNKHADGGGYPANTGNWMIEYQEHMTFVNQGKKERTLQLNMDDNGSLLLMVRDSQTGEILDTNLTIGKYDPNQSYAYKLTVPPNSAKQITLMYVLMPNSAGAVTHSVTIEAP